MLLHDIKLSYQVWFPQAQLARWEHNVLAQESTGRHMNPIVISMSFKVVDDN